MEQVIYSTTTSVACNILRRHLVSFVKTLLQPTFKNYNASGIRRVV